MSQPSADAIAQARALTCLQGILRSRYDGSHSGCCQLTNAAELFSVLEFAAKHRVEAALAETVSAQTAEAGSSWHPLVAPIALKTTRRNLMLRDVALRVARHLRNAGVPYVFLKGAAWIIEDPGAAGWRQLSDIDLLVPPDQIARCAQVLVAAGFSTEPGSPDYDLRSHHHAAPLRDPISRASVELHGRLMRNPRDNLVDTDTIFASAVTLRAGAEPMAVPSPEHRMIHLIAHAQISNWGYALRAIEIKDLVDAAELFRRHSIDWPVVRQAFDSIGATPALDGFLLVAHRLIGLPLPWEARQSSSAVIWADAAERDLTVPPPVWARAARIIGQYVRSYARHPARISVAMATFSDRSRRQLLRRVAGRRLGRFAP